MFKKPTGRNFGAVWGVWAFVKKNRLSQKGKKTEWEQGWAKLVEVEDGLWGGSGNNKVTVYKNSCKRKQK